MAVLLILIAMTLDLKRGWGSCRQSNLNSLRLYSKLVHLIFSALLPPSTTQRYCKSLFNARQMLQAR